MFQLVIKQNFHFACVGQLVSCGNCLLTGSVGQNVRLWSTVGVGEMRLPGENNGVRVGGLTMEDEMNLDGAVCSVSFDDSLEMVNCLWSLSRF